MTPLQLGINFHSIMKFEKYSASTQLLLEETGWSSNQVLESGLDYLSVGHASAYLYVGAGTSPPDKYQTSLEAYVARSNSVQQVESGRNLEPGNLHYWTRHRVRFPAGAIVGNIGEAGYGWGNANANHSLLNRVRIKDFAGSPTVLSIRADEFLDAIVETRFYPRELATGTFNLYDRDGAIVSTHEYTIGAVLRGNPSTSSSIPEIGRVSFTTNQLYIYGNTAVSDFSSFTTVPSTTAIVNNANAAHNHVVSYPSARSVLLEDTIALDYGNTSNHKAFCVPISGFGTRNNDFLFKWEIYPSIPKDNTKRIRYAVQFTWGAYEG